MRTYLVIFSGTFLTLFCSVWIWCVFHPMNYLSVGYPIAKAKLKLLYEMKPIDGLVVGDSRIALGLNPSRFNDNVLNFAVNGTCTAEHFFLIRKALTVTHPKYVILSPSLTSFYRDSLFYEKANLMNELFPYALNDELRIASRQHNDDSIVGPMSPFDIDVRLKLFLISIQFPSYQSSDLLKALVENRFKTNTASYSYTSEHRGIDTPFYREMKSTPAEDSDVSLHLTHFQPPPLFSDYFNQTLDLLDHQHIEVYFIAAPHTKRSCDEISQTVKDEFKKYLDAEAVRHANFHVVGGLFDTCPDNNFSDESHLNYQSALLWSDQVAHELNKSIP